MSSFEYIFLRIFYSVVQRDFLTKRSDAFLNNITIISYVGKTVYMRITGNLLNFLISKVIDKVDACP